MYRKDGDTLTLHIYDGIGTFIVKYLPIPFELKLFSLLLII